MSGLVLGLLIEAVTCFNRFALGLRAADHLDLLTWATFGVRAHHGYFGLACLAVWAATSLMRRFRAGLWRSAFLTVGIGLALSDAVHHFVVLWPITGSPEFP